MSFDQFLSHFPIVEPPFTITDASIDTFRQTNDYLPGQMIEDWIIPIEGEEPDEFTEFFPCLRLPTQGSFEAFIYWKASLLRYEFILATLTKKGTLISKKIISGMLVQDPLIIKSVANVDADLIIHIMTGSFFHEDLID
ncbi:MAG TPA: hypothetical protein PKD85_07450, partial [Saprospiraceae bacterium]|nr:hypothetical protein [Saprospiraceae bacterium]